jgi:hypothetical protein
MRPRASQFSSLKEQLNAVKSGGVAVQRKTAFDPSSQSLGVLKKRKDVKGKKGVLSLEGSSEEDSSSSSSSSEDEGDD